jgi:predicted O-methyltransferase YrrM
MRIVMLHYGNGDAITMTNAATEQLKKVTKRPYRLDLIINGGDDVTGALRAPAVHWPERLGLAAAYNKVLREDDPRHATTVFLHNDCIVAPGWEDALEEVAFYGNCAFPKVINDPRSPVPPAHPSTPPSCCWALPRSLWLKTKGFDEQYEFCHFEDFDIWLQCQDLGARLYRARTSVFHARGFTRAREAEDANAALVANHERFVKKWNGMKQPVVEEAARDGQGPQGAALRAIREKVLLKEPREVNMEKWFELFRGVEATDWMLPLFYSMAAYPPKCIVGEIGMRGGTSTGALLMGVRGKGGHVYSMDIEECLPGREFMERLGLSEHHTFLHGDSKELDFPEPLDVLYIDGDHSYGGARADLERHYESVKLGGVIMLHDPCSHPDDVGVLCKEYDIPVISIGAGLGIFIKTKEFLQWHETNDSETEPTS